ncbi:Plant invertase/pectin methylesterase inhibitor superfamily protein [Raphanus sativus]|uniref:21 kDa protein-like n=1 Tax=Raphanus sativus TaxID=3726 RepID=A0A6J0KJR4_RAPSA|nr:21 kDa protein-like [Raphanus sativus]KAJ4871094.1 Plant invertase/pectin methylesterase inhibitor superfamily protein [Raphanus sativus]
MARQLYTMSFLHLATLLFIFRTISAVGFPPAPPTTTNHLDFIRTSCNATLYPDVCFTSLAGYASAVQDNPARLAKLAIGVSLSRAKHTVSYLSKLSRAAASASPAVHDCVSNVGDAVEQMHGSLQQLREMNHRRPGAPAFRFQMSNVQTWMSAALTDEETCTDGITEEMEEGETKTAVCERVADVKRFTSNALALVNTYANNGA